jgi:hypothetical protein
MHVGVMGLMPKWMYRGVDVGLGWVVRVGGVDFVYVGPGLEWVLWRR